MAQAKADVELCCPALPNLSTRADVFKRVNHRNLRCSTLRGLRCLRLNVRRALPKACSMQRRLVALPHGGAGAKLFAFKTISRTFLQRLYLRYLLTKTFIRTFSSIFVTISHGRATPSSLSTPPVGTTAFCHTVTLGLVH